MDERRLRSLEDDARMYTARLRALGAEIVYGGVEGVRLGTSLWHYLRARHYAHQAVAVATVGIESSRGRRRDAQRDRVADLRRELEGALEVERHMQSVLVGTWAAEAVAEQLRRRDPAGGIQRVVAASEVGPLGADLLDDDDLEEVERALTLRHDARVVARELGRTCDGEPGPIEAIASSVRERDDALVRLLASSSALERCATDILDRFYAGLDREATGDAGDVLLAEDFPWLGLEGRSARGADRQRGRWWV